jgi:hypothetical protein
MKERCIRYKLSPKELFLLITKNKFQLDLEQQENVLQQQQQQFQIQLQLQQHQQQQQQQQLKQTSSSVLTTTTTTAAATTNNNEASSTKPKIVFNDNNTLEEENEELKKRCEDLQEDLDCADQEIKELEDELFQSLQKKNYATGALLFFSILSEGNYIETLSYLLQQLSSLKPFVVSNVQIDFVTLKKKIQSCVVFLPSLEKLISKYSKLHKKWAYDRLNWFAERNLVGGLADSYSSCPLCLKDMLETTKQDFLSPTKFTKKNSNIDNFASNCHLNLNKHNVNNNNSNEVGKKSHIDNNVVVSNTVKYKQGRDLREQKLKEIELLKNKNIFFAKDNYNKSLKAGNIKNNKTLLLLPSILN